MMIDDAIDTKTKPESRNNKTMRHEVRSKSTVVSKKFKNNEML